MGDNIAKYRFDAFGGMFAGVLAPYSFQGITGKEYDPKSGLMYYNSRWYNPQIGRFTQPDSFKGYITNPVSQHPYAYVGNNPINRIDPTGHDSDIPEWLDWDDDGQVDWDQDDSDTFDQDGDNVADWLQDDYSDEWEYNDGTGWDWVGGGSGGSGGSSSDGDWGYGDDGGYSGGGGSSYHEPTKAERKTAFTGVAGRPAASVGLPKAKNKTLPPSTQAVKNKATEKILKTITPLPMKSEKNQKVEKVVQQILLLSATPSNQYKIPQTERERKRILYEGTLTEEQAKINRENAIEFLKNLTLPDPNSDVDMAFIELEKTRHPVPFLIGATGIVGGKIVRGALNKVDEAVEALKDIFKGTGKVTKTHGHHSDPKYLGGDPKQKLTDIDVQDHIDIHKQIDKKYPRNYGKKHYDNLREGDPDFDNNVQKDLTDIYNKYNDKYPELLDDFNNNNSKRR